MDGSSVKLNKTIVILTPGFPADEGDSTCIPALQDFVFSLNDHAERIFVLTFQYPFREGWYEWNRTRIYSAGGQNRKFFLRLLSWRKIWKQLKAIQAELKIDVIHTFWLDETTLIGERFSRRNKIGLVATVFGQDALRSNRYLRFLNYKKMKLVANSEFTAETFFKSTGHRVNEIIHFGLNPKVPDGIKIKESVRDIDILGVGSLIRVKNYELFIETIARVAAEFQELIRKNNLENNIVLKGVLPREEVFEHMKRSRIFLHTSSYESAGMVFLESLYCGCELVCLDTGFVPATSHAHVCKDSEEIVATLKMLYRKVTVHEKIRIPLIEETVQKFIQVYEQ